MSRERHGRYVGRLLEILPGAEVVDEDLGPAWDAVERHRDGAVDTSTSPGLMSLGDPSAGPEMQQALSEYVRQMEAEWIDESIPALGGLTPREALVDPTRRADLLRLLNTMPNTPNGFSPTRLRALLGLGEP